MANMTSLYPQFCKYVGIYKVNVFYYRKSTLKSSLFKEENKDFWVKGEKK